MRSTSTWCSTARRHHSVLAHPELAARSFAVFSFGKTLHATGLRVGYCVAPPALTRELRKVHQFNTFSISHPLQHAIAAYLAERPDCGAELAGFFQAKRDRLRARLAASGFRLPPAQGTYFQLLDFSAFAAGDDIAFAERLLTRGGRGHASRCRRSMRAAAADRSCACAWPSATARSMRRPRGSTRSPRGCGAAC